jgi:hypothetical protein
MYPGRDCTVVYQHLSVRGQRKSAVCNGANIVNDEQVRSNKLIPTGIRKLGFIKRPGGPFYEPEYVTIVYVSHCNLFFQESNSLFAKM